MQLIKYCKPEHNIKQCSKIRLGTLYQYRKIENDEIQDGEEGSFQFQLNFKGEVEVENELASLLFKDAMDFGLQQDNPIPQLPGTTSIDIENLKIVRRLEKSIILKDTVALIKRTTLNSFIFCMSARENAKNNPFDGYNDNWSIPFYNANLLAHRISQLMFSQAKLGVFETVLLKNHTLETVPQLQLLFRHQKVLYRDRTINITSGEQVSTKDLLKTISDIPFTKPTDYANECEYRFVFELTDRGRICPPISKYIDLELNALALL